MDRGAPNPNIPPQPHLVRISASMAQASRIAAVGGILNTPLVAQQPQQPSLIAVNGASTSAGGMTLAMSAPSIQAHPEQPLYLQGHEYGATQPPSQPPSHGSAGEASSTSIPHQGRPRKLQVDDALSYLEQVRQQFSSQPDVYNDFLEVMKEFKSHNIDTQGVIRRVSRLFSGHPNLINGFNTFLPPGFEVSVVGSFVRIQEPSGENTFVNNANGELVTQRDMATLIQQTVQGVAPTKIEHPGDLQPPISLHTSVSGPAAVASSLAPQPPSQLATARLQIPPGVMQVAAQLQKRGSDCSVVSSQQQPIHFDQAVGYLNKIKERFANTPAVYKEFLSILGNYQKLTTNRVSTSKETSEVYEAVARLFRNEEDLMHDFKSFLPDTVINLDAKDKATPGVGITVKGERKLASTLPESKTLGKRRASEEKNVATKKSKSFTHDDACPSIRECLEDVPLKDLLFFEKVQKALRNEVVVMNFFRSLVLYNKSLVSRHELLELTTPFLSPFPDLLKQFHDILGIGVRGRSPSRVERMENRFPSEIAAQIDFATCRRLGASYRSVPEVYSQSKCTGRTALCKSVLNDTWVSFPSWSSEDTSSVSSKKSQYEDFMYRTEDERFEVDILIEVNSAAIKTLELVRKKLESMGAEEAKKYVAETNFGCTSSVLLSRAVKKLYGEHAAKILEGMRENPLNAVPQVLKRMREKDTEWRAVRKEFNAIWQDQIDKNYLKSLDHQATHFKANDVKFLRSKAIIQQLENCYDEQQTRMDKEGVPAVGPHLLLKYPENTASVIHDVNDLLIHHVKRQQSINKKEKFAIKKHLRSLLPRLFNLSAETMSEDEEEESDEEGSDKSEDGEEIGEGVTTRGSKNGFKKKRLKAEPSESASKKAPPSSEGYTLFYSSNAWILFLRLHHIICERLSVMKRCAEELDEEYNFEILVRKRQAKLYEKHGKAAPPEENAVDVHLGLRELKKPLQNPKDFYQTLIQELKNALDGITDSTSFEDALRNMFGTNAYIMFTMDKLISIMTRQLQNFVSDEVGLTSTRLFNKYCAHKFMAEDREHPTGALPVDELYDLAAEKLMANENCFKIHFIHQPKPTVAVELISTEESDDEEIGDETDEERDYRRLIQLSKWWDYVRRYASDSAGDDENGAELETGPRKPLFLTRNVLRRKSLIATPFTFFSFSSPPPSGSAGEQLQFLVNRGLRAVLSTDNVRLLYERGTADVMFKMVAPNNEAEANRMREITEKRHSRFEDWVNLHNEIEDDDRDVTIDGLFHHH